MKEHLEAGAPGEKIGRLVLSWGGLEDLTLDFFSERHFKGIPPFVRRRLIKEVLKLSSANIPLNPLIYKFLRSMK